MLPVIIIPRLFWYGPHLVLTGGRCDVLAFFRQSAEKIKKFALGTCQNTP